MPDPLDIQHESALEGFLKWLGRPGAAVRDVLGGNFGGAVRQAGDFFLDPIDAVLPGDVLPELSRPEDYKEFSDLIGGMEPGIGKTAVDIIGGIATDPMTFLGVGPLAKAGTIGLRAGAEGAANLASKTATGAAAVQGAKDIAAKTGLKVREVADALRVAPQLQKAIKAGQDVREGTIEAGTAANRAALEGLQPEDLSIMGELQHNLWMTPSGPSVVRASVPNTPRARLTEEVLSRQVPVSQMPSLTAGEAWKQVKKPGEYQNIDDLAKAIGVEGVAIPELAGQNLEAVTKNPELMWEKVFHPQYADEAAMRTLSHYPITTTEARFASGIELANKDYGLSRPIERLRGDIPLGPTPSLTASQPSLLEQFNAIKGTKASAGGTWGEVAKMLGAQDIPATKVPGIELVKSPGEAAAYLSGASKTAPEMEYISGKDAERALFTDRRKLEDAIQHIDDVIRDRGLPPDQAARIRQAMVSDLLIKQKAWQDRVVSGVVEPQIGQDLQTTASNYAPRFFTETDPIMEMFKNKGGGASTANLRKNITPESLAGYLKENPSIQLETNAAKMAGAYTQQQGNLLGRAAFSQELIKPYVASYEKKIAEASKTTPQWEILPAEERLKAAGITEPERMAYEANGKSLYTLGDKGELSKATDAIIKDIAEVQRDPESALALSNFWNGMPAREGVWKALASVNQVFKPFATAGAFIPRINFNIRNAISGAEQILSNPEARKHTGSFIKALPSIIGGAIDDGFEKLSGGRIRPGMFRQVDDALANSNGSIYNAINALPKDSSMQLALKHGVITDGFGNTELLANELGKSGWKKKLSNIMYWPSDIAKGVEKRMRFTLFDGLLSDHIPPEEAARITQDTFYSYRIGNQANRAARDVIPFFQFSAKAIPQQAKFLMESGPIPSVARNTIENLYNQGNNAILPPQLQDQPVIPIGKDESGNPKYLTSFGMPYEALGQIPNLTGDLADIGPEIRQNLVAASNPAIKTAASAVFGIDPYFGTPFGSYDKAPYLAQALGADKESHAARTYNILAGAGAIQPISSPVSVLSNFLDPRRSTTEAALNTLTGIRIKSVDEQQALRQLLEESLKRNPDVQRYESLYQTSGDPETQALLQELSKLKADIRKKKKDEKAKN